MKLLLYFFVPVQLLGVEILLHSSGLFHRKLRDALGYDKAGRLVFLFLPQQQIWVDDETKNVKDRISLSETLVYQKPSRISGKANSLLASCYGNFENFTGHRTCIFRYRKIFHGL